MRSLRAGQCTQVLIGGPAMTEPRLMVETSDILLEAPNWSADGRALFLNGDGALWSLSLDGPRPALHRIDHHGLPAINNDHVLHPDGEHILMSAQDGQIYRGRVQGGSVEKLTSGPGGHYLHGISPDGDSIAYVDLEHGVGRLRIRHLATGEVTAMDAGAGHMDGPEFTPDGGSILMNSEAFSATPGHAQLARIPVGGGELARLVESSTVDWFPHLSPDGRYGCYLSYPAGTTGHPADLPVTVTTVEAEDWRTPLQRYDLFGGQGTLNVNSWSPASDRFAMVAYPLR